MLHQYQAHDIPYQKVVLPCGHYTTARFPFKYLDGWLFATPTIAQVVYGFPFQDNEVLNHLADGFEVAGVREGIWSRYSKLDRETRLSGQEIKSLLFGHTINGRDYWNGNPWTQVRTIGGKVSHSGIAIHTGGGFSNAPKEGESWVEDDRLCENWFEAGGEITICALVFLDSVKCWKNNAGRRRCGEVVPPEYAQRIQSSYFLVTDPGPNRFHVLDE